MSYTLNVKLWDRNEKTGKWYTTYLHSACNNQKEEFHNEITEWLNIVGTDDYFYEFKNGLEKLNLVDSHLFYFADFIKIAALDRAKSSENVLDFLEGFDIAIEHTKRVCSEEFDLRTLRLEVDWV